MLAVHATSAGVASAPTTIITADLRIIVALLLIGGRNADGPVATTWKSKLDSKGALGKWAPEQSLAAPQADGVGLAPVGLGRVAGTVAATAVPPLPLVLVR